MARTADGTPPAVPTVTTDGGDYVLDNLSPAILPWTATGYSWIARQRPGLAQWAFVGPAQAGDQKIASAEIMP